MRLHLLNYGVAADHPGVVSLSRFGDSNSISDYDGLLFDPDRLEAEIRPLCTGSNGHYTTLDGNGVIESLLARRRREVGELLDVKGGVIVCLLRTKQSSFSLDVRKPGKTSTHWFNTYEFFRELKTTSGSVLPIHSISEGAGTNFKVLSGGGPLSTYFGKLRGNLRFEAFFNLHSSSMAKPGEVEVFAVNSVEKPIAAQFRVGEGSVIFIPVPIGVSRSDFGIALVQTVKNLVSRNQDVETPQWAEEILVPGAEAHISRINELEQRIELATSELDELKRQRDAVLQFRVLLFGSGKFILEPVVREAFRRLGFDVPDPDSYAGEWDMEGTADGRSLIGEIEGAEGAVAVNKFRQLLQYVTEEVLEGKDPKGILVGNGFRAEEPQNRGEQFSEHVLRGAAKNSFCLVPTTELFKAVCAVLSRPDDEELRSYIRETLYEKTGIWEYSERPSTEAEQAALLKSEDT